MKVCNECGSEYSDRIDFCFYDGEVLTAAAVGGAGLDDAFDLPMPGAMNAPVGKPDDFTFRPALAPIKLPGTPSKVLPTAPPPATPLSTPPPARVTPAPAPESQAPPPSAAPVTATPAAPPVSKAPEPAPVEDSFFSDPEPEDDAPPPAVPLWVWVGGGAAAAVLVLGMGGFALASLGFLGATLQKQVASQPAPTQPTVTAPVTTPDDDHFPEPPLQLGVQGTADDTDDTDALVDTDTLVDTDAGLVDTDAPDDTLDGDSDSASDAGTADDPDTDTNAAASATPGTPDEPSTDRQPPPPVEPDRDTAGTEPPPIIEPDTAAQAEPEVPSPWGSTPEPAEPSGDDAGNVLVFLVGDASGLKLYVDGRLQVGNWPHTVRLSPGMHKFRVETATGGGYEIGKPVQFTADGTTPQIRLGAP